MKVPFFNMPKQIGAIKNEIDAAIKEVIDEGHFVGGQSVVKFEEQFAEYNEVDHCLSCANGTDAIELALEALGISEDDEVIVPNHTWTSTASAVTRLGGIPVFAKSSEKNFNIDIEDIKDRITDKTKAIIGVHLYGNPCDAVGLKQLAQSNNLFFIEDCAQAHGAKINNKKVGGFGDIATFSFYPSKNLGCFGDGGCITTNNSEIADSISILKNCGQITKNQHSVPGRNSRLDTIQAAVLIKKLSLLDNWNNMRIEAAKLYRDNLVHPWIKFQEVKEANVHVYHIFFYSN